MLLQDTREQTPLLFPDDEVRVVTLTTGDYSIMCDDVDFRDRIAIERKSLSDLFGTVGNGRARFEREISRLAALERAAIVIEATMQDVIAGAPFSQMNPRSVMGSLLAWYARYGIAPIFAGSRELAAATVRKILTKFIEPFEEG